MGRVYVGQGVRGELRVADGTASGVQDALREMRGLRREIEDVRGEITEVESQLGNLRDIGRLARWSQSFKLCSLKWGLAKRLDELQVRYRMARNSHLQLRRDEAHCDASRCRQL